MRRHARVDTTGNVRAVRLRVSRTTIVSRSASATATLPEDLHVEAGRCRALGRPNCSGIYRGLPVAAGIVTARRRTEILKKEASSKGARLSFDRAERGGVLGVAREVSSSSRAGS